MYVIFPADEIILLSYGATIPRFHPRPTLDNLRDPLVPLRLGLRSVSTPATTPTINCNNQLQVATPSPKPKRVPSPNISFADDFLNSKSSNHSQEEDANTDFINARSSSVETSNNLLSESSAISSNNINLIGNNINETISGKKKSKIKSKLQISLGRLGRPHSHEPPPSRLRGEDLKIHVSNPTFTSDNLRANNYDAFFASGEPVYSLEKKEKLRLESEVVPESPAEYSDKTRSNSLSIFHKVTRCFC